VTGPAGPAGITLGSRGLGFWPAHCRRLYSAGFDGVRLVKLNRTAVRQAGRSDLNLVLKPGGLAWLCGMLMSISPQLRATVLYVAPQSAAVRLSLAAYYY
jgi:hypothetical protein